MISRVKLYWVIGTDLLFRYLTNFAGWLVAAFTNVHLTARIGMGGVFVFGSFLQMIAYCLMFWVFTQSRLNRTFYDILI